MRPAHLAMLALLSLLVIGACTSASAGWTYEPAPSATPAPSAEASGAASGAPSGSAGASAAPGASGSAAPSAGASAGAAVVTIVAQGIAFTTPAVSAPAGTAVTLEFDNQDTGTPHDVQIKDGTGAQVFKTDIFPGVEKRSFPVPALTAGTYPFTCTVHPTMTGTLTVQ
jgi:plastocyanin